MKNLLGVDGKLEIRERMKNSVNGNPRYRIAIDGFECVTKPDSAYAYDIQNLNGKEVKAVVGTHYGKQMLDRIEGK